MKTKAQEQAYKLYFQQGLTKTAIAEKLGISRRTVYQWSVDGDWDTIKQSARCMPSILAHKCYLLIGHFTDHLLQRDSAYRSVTKDDVNILTKLVNNVSKLKVGSTSNENMETFTMFLEGMKYKDPDLADKVQPHVGEFIASGATMSQNSMVLHGFDPDGSMPFPDEAIRERWLDEEDLKAIYEEKQRAAAGKEETVPAADVTRAEPRKSFYTQTANEKKDTTTRPLYPNTFAVSSGNLTQLSLMGKTAQANGKFVGDSLIGVSV